MGAHRDIDLKNSKLCHYHFKALKSQTVHNVSYERRTFLVHIRDVQSFGLHGPHLKKKKTYGVVTTQLRIYTTLIYFFFFFIDFLKNGSKDFFLN